MVWRDSHGTAHALRDLCIHRGTALSLGRVIGDRLMCPYHGWQYGSDGVCKLIPQLEDPTNIPGKARVDAFTCDERYGMLWVAMEEPRYELPAIPEFDDRDWVVVRAGPYAWNSDASRQLENFTDFGHFPWVHPGLLGDPERPVVPDYTVKTEGHVLLYDVVRPEAPNSDDFPVFGNETAVAPERRSSLPAAPAVHDPAAARVGRREGDGLLLQLAAGRRGPLHRLRDDRAQLRPRAAGLGAAGLRGHDLRSGPASWSSPSGRSGCRSTSRPRCT